MNATRRGFTLLELMVSITIGTLVIMALYQILQLQSQSVRLQTAQISVQQANRASLAVLTSELREVDAAEGDLVLAASESLTVRVARKLGVVCRADTLASQLNVWGVGDDFAAGDSVFVFADKDTAKASDDAWTSGAVIAVDTLLSTLSCPAMNIAGESSRRRLLTFVSEDQVSGVHRGAFVRTFTYLTYGIYNVDGEWVIGRHEPGGDLVPLIGPVQSPTNGGLRFTYVDTLGAALTPTTAAQRAAVRRIKIKVRGVNDPDVEVFSDSLVTQVFLRNE